MKKKIFTLFDNTNDYEKRADVKSWLFDFYAEDYNWTSLADIPENMIEDYIYKQNRNDWDNFKAQFEKILDGSYFLIKGYCGRWNGRQDGGKFITTFKEFFQVISHLDYLSITDINGHLVIEGSHHDGNDRYELKKLTKKGYEYANKNCFSNTRKLHQVIFYNNFYSCLPKLASLQGE